MTISIITPVFQAESFLPRLVNSVLSQTYCDWELILVDDGSTDRSGMICDEFTKQDTRIKVIHKKNGGVSSARQAGLDAVRGEFVIHADSDDWLDQKMLEDLVQHQKQTSADIIVFDFYRVSNGNQLRISQKPQALNNKQVLKDIISGHLYACCWNKLVRRSLILKYGASFPKGINLGEDKCFLAVLLKNPVSVSYLPLPLYYYDASINAGSLVRQITEASMRSGFAMVDYLEKELGKEYESEIYNIKRNLKLRAIESGLYKNHEIRRLYKEINKTIILKVLILQSHSKDDIKLLWYLLKP